MSLIGKIEEESDFNSLKTNNNNNNPLLIELTDKLKCLLNKSENTRKEILKPNDENEKEKENENIGEKSKKKFNLLSGLNIPRDISVNRRSTVRNMPSVSKKKKEGQKKNMSVYFGHENWNLVLNMMIGVRTSIKSIYEINEVFFFIFSKIIN